MHMGLHLENEVARLVASDHHRLMFVESCKVCNKFLECCSIKYKNIYTPIVYDKLLKPDNYLE